jgi:hypothetical protein
MGINWWRRYRIGLLLTGSILLLASLSIISINWIRIDNYSTPPSWAKILAVFSLILGGLILLLIIIVIFRRFLLHTDISNSMKKNNLINFLNLSGLIDPYLEFKHNINNGKIIVPSMNYERQLLSFKLDIEERIDHYRYYKLLNFFLQFVLGIFSIILVFAFSYLALYSIQPQGFVGSMPHSMQIADSLSQTWSTGDWIVESLYYSVTTFTTLGYGDIRPGICICPRLLSIFEVMCNILILTIGIGFGASFLKTFFDIDTEYLIKEIDNQFQIQGFKYQTNLKIK